MGFVPRSGFLSGEITGSEYREASNQAQEARVFKVVLLRGNSEKASDEEYPAEDLVFHG